MVDAPKGIGTTVDSSGSTLGTTAHATAVERILPVALVIVLVAILFVVCEAVKNVTTTTLGATPSLCTVPLSHLPLHSSSARLRWGVQIERTHERM